MVEQLPTWTCSGRPVNSNPVSLMRSSSLGKNEPKKPTLRHGVRDRFGSGTTLFDKYDCKNRATPGSRQTSLNLDPIFFQSTHSNDTPTAQASPMTSNTSIIQQQPLASSPSEVVRVRYVLAEIPKNAQRRRRKSLDVSYGDSMSGISKVACRSSPLRCMSICSPVFATTTVTSRKSLKSVLLDESS